MSREPSPIFVARRTYQGRRMADAARLLPVFGGILFLIPLLWRAPASEAGTVQVMLYVFLVWIFLIGVAATLSRSIPKHESEGPQLSAEPEALDEPASSAHGTR